MTATDNMAKFPTAHTTRSPQAIFLAHKSIPWKISEKSEKVASFFRGGKNILEISCCISVHSLLHWLYANLSIHFLQGATP
jgi:hypothetical protein